MGNKCFKEDSTEERNGQNFDYFLILDFEATCIKSGKIKPQEVIEFPCLKMCTRTLEVTSTFHFYVKPVHRPELTDFCTGFTGITQEMVENERPFEEVFNDFELWMQNEVLKEKKKKFTFITFGDWDLNVMLTEQMSLIGREIPTYMDQWVNVKKSFEIAMKYWAKDIKSMMEGLDLEYEGREHSGIDQCKNLVKIVENLCHRGHTFENNFTRRRPTNN